MKTLRAASMLAAMGVGLVLLAAGARAQIGSPSMPKNVLTARAALAQPPLQAGGAATLQVHLTVRPTFHINANPASEEYLIPTQVIVNPQPGLSVGKPLYPTPKSKKFVFFNKPLSVYEKTLLVRVPLRAGAAFRNEPITGIVKYQACNDRSCLPPAQTTFSTDGATKLDQSTLATPAGGNGRAGADADFAAATILRERFGVQGIPQVVFLDEMGKERRDLRAGEELTLPTMTQKLAALHSGNRLSADSHSAGGMLARLQNSPLWLQLALAFGFGLLLNLTPCVYPMIPITVGYFGAQSEGRVGKTFGLAAFYVLGLALTYSSLGVFAALSGSFFGAALQSPYAIGFIAVVLFALSLSMFGLFTLQPPQFVMARSGAKKGAVGALAMGALLGIVAAPCVGPIVGALLTYVGARADVVLGFSLFFALSLGLGLPYLLLGTFSGALKSLPRSGAWLEKSKKFFAVPLLLASLYYAYLALKPPAANAHWPRATLAAIEQAKREQRPVVLDFRADWCLPCLKLEKEVFARPEFPNAAGDAVLLQVDLTRADS